MPPKVSVVMAVGPFRPYVKEAIKSLWEQTFKDFEILTQTEPGVVLARNEGFRKAEGEYVAIQDADDISYTPRFEMQVNYLDKHPEVSVLGSWGRRIGDRSGICHPPTYVTKNKLFLWDRVIHTSAMMRKEDVMPFGPYRDVLYEDWDLWIRLVKAGKIIRNLPNVLVAFRFTDGGLGSRVPRKVWYSEAVKERLFCLRNS